MRDLVAQLREASPAVVVTMFLIVAVVPVTVLAVFVVVVTGVVAFVTVFVLVVDGMRMTVVVRFFVSPALRCVRVLVFAHLARLTSCAYVRTQVVGKRERPSPARTSQLGKRAS